MEYYIYNIPVFIVSDLADSVSIPDFCAEVENHIPSRLLQAVEVVYIGKFRELQDRNAMYSNGGIYISSDEPTNFDMLEDFIHEVAHSLDTMYGMMIYDDDLIQEFKGKRQRLYDILTARDYHVNPLLYSFTEYNKKFDSFLANDVGYPTLLNLTMGLFVSPYGATSIQEYFANGFEKYFLENPRTVRKISPVLYRKIEEIIDEDS